MATQYFSVLVKVVNGVLTRFFYWNIMFWFWSILTCCFDVIYLYIINYIHMKKIKY